MHELRDRADFWTNHPSVTPRPCVGDPATCRKWAPESKHRARSTAKCDRGPPSQERAARPPSLDAFATLAQNFTSAYVSRAVTGTKMP